MPYRAVAPSPPAPRTCHHSAFDAARLAAARGAISISVCIPARDEEATVGPIVRSVRQALVAEAGGCDLVDEVVVVDDGSNDATQSEAMAAGARVVGAAARGKGLGKGEAMRAGLSATVGDLVCFLDADVVGFSPHFVTGLVGPLLVDPSDPMRGGSTAALPETALVKGFYERPVRGLPGEGGRVTELVAKPVIELLYPELSWLRQPLAGETAAPRKVLEEVGLEGGYGVEFALLLDVAARHGAGSIAQVDLGTRVHRNRPLAELRPQAREVLRVALERARAQGRTSTGPAKR